MPWTRQSLIYLCTSRIRGSIVCLLTCFFDWASFPFYLSSFCLFTLPFILSLHYLFSDWSYLTHTFHFPSALTRARAPHALNATRPMRSCHSLTFVPVFVLFHPFSSLRHASCSLRVLTLCAPPLSRFPIYHLCIGAASYGIPRSPVYIVVLGFCCRCGIELARVSCAHK